jgi:hypothetical protein
MSKTRIGRPRSVCRPEPVAGLLARLLLAIGSGPLAFITIDLVPSA